MPKMQLVLRSIGIFSIVVLVLGLLASGAVPISGTNSDKSLFSGQIPTVTLSPKPEPPATYVIGMNIGIGLFSGQTLTAALNSRPEPPRTYAIENNNFKSMFSGQIQTVSLNPQPEPPKPI